MKRLILKLSLAAIATTGLSTSVQAQDITCADLTFKRVVYERWPFADEACLEVVTREDGYVYARFEAEVVSQSPGGTYVRYTLQDGTQTPSRKANPPEGVMAVIDGVPTAIEDLSPRQEVRIYLPSSAWQQAQAAAAEPPPPPPPPPEPEPEPEPVMPTTAGNLGWLVLAGSLLLLMGGALRYYSRRA